MCFQCDQDDGLIAALNEGRPLSDDERDLLIGRLEEMKEIRAEASGEGL